MTKTTKNAFSLFELLLITRSCKLCLHAMNMVYIELRKQLKGFDKSKKGLLQLHMLHNVEL